MIIKIDCREKELLDIMVPKSVAIASSSDDTTVPSSDFYMMDLGDGMTMKIPLPKTKSTSIKNRRVTPAPFIDTHEIKSERLPLGDIIIYDPLQNKEIVMFERKTLYDLAASIQDGRYKEQSFRLSQTVDFHNHNIIYIIEGDLSKYDAKRGRISKTAIQSAMVSLMYYKGFSVFRTMNADETAGFIYNFADKVDKEKGEQGFYLGCQKSTSGELGITATAIDNTDDTGNNTVTTMYCEVASKKEKRDYITRDNIGEIMLSQVPGISPKIAMAIMKKYSGSLFDFLSDLKRKTDDYED